MLAGWLQPCLRSLLRACAQEREKITNWLANTMRPGLQALKQDIAAQFESIKATQAEHEQQLEQIKAWIRQQPRNAPQQSAASVDHSVIDELRRELEAERMARQQMALWVKSNFGPKLELLDNRIELKIAARVAEVHLNASNNASSAGGAGGNGVNANAPLATSSLGGSGGMLAGNSVSLSELVILPVSVREWLLQIGYDRYIGVFQEAGITSLAQAAALTVEALNRCAG